MTSTSSRDDRPLLRLGHSPDPDDAFMWWPITGGGGHRPAIETTPFRYEAVLDDIESLNARAEHGELEITAISAAHCPRIASSHVITACGASMGEGVGPCLVSSEPMDPGQLSAERITIAVPGRRTSAYAATALRLGEARFAHEVVPFDRILPLVAEGTFRAGLIIHEDQLSWARHGLHLVEDLGRWWTSTHDLPLPLGLNVVRRDLDARYGPDTLVGVAATLRTSIEHALDHEDAAVARAMSHARGMDEASVRRFIGMYVNPMTIDLGTRGREAISVFLQRCSAIGLVSSPDPPEILEPAWSTTS